MQALQVLSLTLLSVLVANAQVLHPGRCPVPPVKENFDVTSVSPTDMYAFQSTGVNQLGEKIGFYFDMQVYMHDGLYSDWLTFFPLQGELLNNGQYRGGSK